jgi:hypothetical protein
MNVQSFLIAPELPSAHRRAGTGKLQAKDYTWRLVMPPDCQVEAMALCSVALAVAGQVCSPRSDDPRSFFWLLSLADGKQIAIRVLHSLPA